MHVHYMYAFFDLSTFKKTKRCLGMMSYIYHEFDKPVNTYSFQYIYNVENKLRYEIA